MARKIRVEFPGAIYHVLDRGDRREPIFDDDEDRRSFLETVGQACERSGWRVHAYVLMSNHYHLMLETPLANLVKGMHWFQTTWTTRFNRKRKESGHVLQGRYKAVVVDPEAPGYFATLSDYIHLNPVRAGIVDAQGDLADYAWSSYPEYVFKRRRSPWLITEVVFGELGFEDRATDRRRYARRLQERALEERDEERSSVERAQIRHGWCLGGETFRQRMLALMETANGKRRQRTHRDPAVARDHAEGEAQRLLSAGLKVLGLRAPELDLLPRGDERKVALAALIRRRTLVSNSWTAAALCMGHPSRVTHCLKMPSDHPLWKKLTKRLGI